MKLCITILKYHSWYLCQISLQFMLLPIQTWLFLLNMVTELMHLNSYQCLSGWGKARHIWGIWHKGSQPVVETFEIANSWDWIDIEFCLTRDTILEWKLRKTILQLHKPRELRTKDGSHIVPIRICGYLIKHMCTFRRRRDECDEN